MEISQETIASILQLGGQYFLPAAALLRAIYFGMRGKMPEGFWQIAAASFFAGLTAITDNQQVNWQDVVAEILGNTIFMAGLLSFIVVYLLRQPNRGQVVDAIVGGILGLVAWVGWVYVLQNDWPMWTAPLVIIAGAAAFIALRFSLRQIGRLVKIATYLLVTGLVLAIGAGGIFLIQWVANNLNAG
ncbi:MAG: hypothetical protein K8L99_01305 [Anaerolineae bacterium]|nr:hypothetical protein [Anaerolineae bacterium]